MTGNHAEPTRIVSVEPAGRVSAAIAAGDALSLRFEITDSGWQIWRLHQRAIAHAAPGQVRQ